MSYQPPGPYPATPQQLYPQQPPQGDPPPPITVKRAYVLMYVGAGLSALSGVLSTVLNVQVQDRINQAVNDGTLDGRSNYSVNQFGSLIGALITLGLWVWMAQANRDGENWARITGTVFFGIATLGVFADLAVFGAMDTWLGVGMFALMIGLAVATWLVGLATVIMLWHRLSGPFFAPAPAPMPGYYMPGYGVTPVGSNDWQQAPPDRQPADPWSTPGG